MHRSAINPKITVSIVFVAAIFMSIMDSTIVNVALPSLSRDFHAVGTSIDAIVVGYLCFYNRHGEFRHSRLV